MIARRSRGETDITAVFGTAIPGSNPGGSTKEKDSPFGESFSIFYFLLSFFGAAGVGGLGGGVIIGLVDGVDVFIAS